MQSFVNRHPDRITGVLTGFDPVLFRGNLQSISCLDQLDGFLLRQRIPYKDFGSVVQTISDRVKARGKAFADANEVVIKDAQNKVIRVPSNQIEQLVPQQRSLMPDLLLRDMTAEQVADFLAYLVFVEMATPAACNGNQVTG